MPLISDVFYDGVGSDDGQSFVELYGAPGTALDGLVLEGINGAGGAVTVTIALSGTIAADGLYLLADVDTGGLTGVPEPDAVANFDFQNGPDSVMLREASGAVLGDPTPGAAPLSVPEPSTGLLAFTAPTVLAAKGRRGGSCVDLDFLYWIPPRLSMILVI